MAVAAQVVALDGLKREFVDREYASLLASRPDDPELCFEVAYVCMALNMPDDARSHVRRASELSGDVARVLTYLGNTYFLEGDLERAVAHYQRAAQIDPDDSGLRENLERALRRHLDEERPGSGAK